jgi:hypothetical protein
MEAIRSYETSELARATRPYPRRPYSRRIFFANDSNGDVKRAELRNMWQHKRAVLMIANNLYPYNNTELPLLSTGYSFSVNSTIKYWAHVDIFLVLVCGYRAIRISAPLSYIPYISILDFWQKRRMLRLFACIPHKCLLHAGNIGHIARRTATPQLHVMLQKNTHQDM